MNPLRTHETLVITGFGTLRVPRATWLPGQKTASLTWPNGTITRFPDALVPQITTALWVDDDPAKAEALIVNAALDALP